MLEAEVAHHLELISDHGPLRIGLVVGGGLGLGGVAVSVQAAAVALSGDPPAAR
jgi:hypothetical protein